MIPFPEEAFFSKKDRFVIYDCESIKENKKLTKEMNKALMEKNFKHPARGIWGKTTNMKPFDWGYFILDDHERLFNIQRGDNRFTVVKIEYPQGIEIEFIKISENRQKNLYGYMIDKKSNFYLISYKDNNFVKLDLPNFDHKSMKLQLISNPLYYQLRYNDEENYYAAVFDKEYNRLDKEMYR